MSENSTRNPLVLVTGATGYVGGRLIPQLIESGFHVRAMGRSLEKLKARFRQYENQIECVAGDVFDYESLKKALTGCNAAYYLVHSMLPGQANFKEADKAAANNMVKAAEATELKRIIYLGGLGEDGEDLSEHLKSRAEVAQLLCQGSVPCTVLRAAMIIGSGSASFEILRYLVDRLPVMITPKWLETPSQPIAIRNVLNYLVGCLKDERTAGKIFDIGGSEILTYRELMKIYAEEAGLPKRLVIPVPVLTPRLSSYWIHIVTPVPASIARPLAEGLKNPVICQNRDIEELVPQELLSPRVAVRRALKLTEEGTVKSHWTDAGLNPPVEAVYAGDPQWAGGTVLKDHRELETGASSESLWDVIQGIGGRRGWYHANWLWVIRGALDKLFGGVGLRRGRRNPNELFVGDALDFWRVLHVEPNRKLLLVAEMKLPGTATLEFTLSNSEGIMKVSQTALFKPKGLWGILYWYGLLPFHHYIFLGMLKAIVRRAEKKNNV